MSSSGSFSSHGGSSSSYSMFPIVEKTYRVRVTEDIERDLRFLGQSRVDALTCDFDMTLVKEKNNLKIYELEEKEFFTMKATTTINAPLSDVMAMLKMDSTPKMRDVMGDVFGAMFLDGVVLYKAKDTPARMNESLSVNWMALQASKPHLPHRDYVFLRYADVFEKNAEHASVYGTTGSGLYIGASIWESIEMDGCAPLPTSQNVVRLRLRRCGFVVEEINHEDTVKVSLYLSEAHPGRAAVSTLTKAWMSKMVACVAEVGNVLVAKALASQNILSKQQIVKDGVCCYLCVKSFTLLRRKHHCRVCGDVVCSKCSEMKSLRQGGMNKEIRVCEQCKNSSSASVRSSDSDSVSRTQRSVGSTSAASGPAVSHSSNGPHKSSSGLPLHTKASISGYSMTSSDASSYEDELYGNASVGGSVSQPVIHENSTSAEPALVRHKSRGPADMIVLNNENDMIYLNNSNKTIRTRTTAPPKSTSSAAEPTSEFAMYTRPQQPPTTASAGVSEEEYAAMELAKTIDENTSFSYALSYSSRQEWPKAPVPANEAERLQRVRALHLVDPGFHFQEMCEYAAAELGCQIASICFVGEKSGFLMARVGVEKQELPRNILFDAHTIMSTEPTIILDASEDIRFLNNPLFTEGKVRFYAGFPLVTSDGFVVGSFSVADPFARECLTGDKFFFLKNLADVAIRGVEQNTRQQLAVGGQVPIPPQQATSVYVPPPPAKDMNYVDAHMTMQELLRTAYTTQHQINMHQNLNPLSQRP